MRKFRITAVERSHYNDLIIEADSEAEAEDKFYEKYDNDELESDEDAIEELNIEEVVD